MKSRNTTIDFLRGLAVLLMILIHTTAYFGSDPIATTIWDYAHIVVPLFLFSSVYISFKNPSSTSLSLQKIIKRLKRLLVPYYLFLVPLFTFIYFHNPTDFTLDKILSKFTLGSDRDLAWLVVLFIYLIFLLPLIQFLYQKHRGLFWFYTTISLLSSFVFLFYIPAIPFRYIMWLPWSIFLIWNLFFTLYEIRPKFLATTLILSSLIFAITRIYLAAAGHTLVFTENKYPPNIYYLSYGIFFTTFFYWLHKTLLQKKLFPMLLEKWFGFFSKYSYSLFFIHFLFVIISVNTMPYKLLHWWGFFVVIMAVSIATQMGLNKIMSATAAQR